MAEPSSGALRATSAARLKRIERLGFLLDNAIRIPGIGYRVGYDAIIGLIPGFGDALGLALSAYIVFEAARFGMPKRTLGQMVWNVAVETAVGTIPLLGDLFDATWKANARNLNLLHAHLGLAPRGRPPSTRRALLVLGAGLFVALLLAGLLVYIAVKALVNLLGG